MNNKQYPDRPSSGGDGGGNDDGSGFSPSRLNHPYQQQQHPHQSSHAHEDDRSSRNHAYHVYIGDGTGRVFTYSFTYFIVQYTSPTVSHSTYGTNQNLLYSFVCIISQSPQKVSYRTRQNRKFPLDSF